MLQVNGITYDHSTNYGSCFQAYALLTAVERICLNGKSVEYKLIPLTQLKDYPGNDITSIVREQGKRKAVLKRLLLRPFLSLHQSQFKQFWEKRLKYVKIERLAELEALNKTADAFICGSDVIWNTDFNNSLGAYYLDFARKYKFSYAASFGKPDISAEEQNSIKEYLAEYNEISCREEAGVRIVDKCIHRKAELVVDPVLLLNHEDWDEIAGTKRSGDQYIFVYYTHINKQIREFTDVIKARTGLKAVYAAGGPKQAIKLRKLQIHKPEEWLRLLRDAEFVITNSFHATAFSILFHKKFFTYVMGEKGSGINVRMYELLKELGLGNRLINKVPKMPDLSAPDFGRADQILADKREVSREFLQRNLEAAYKEKRKSEKQMPLNDGKQE